MSYASPDLTQHPPRGPRVQLAGFVILPRMLDKGRAALAGTNGEYHYNCPLDQRFLEFAGVDPEAMEKELAAGRGDREMGEWVLANSTTKPSALEIAVWSGMQVERTPGDLDSREFFNEVHKGAGPEREDIHTWFDLLDLDDFATFGGKA
ncbi:MAG: hypothetical protein ACI9VS_001917 [Candidatus Binatia bacterium]|jgi:hypothetical protein